MDFFEALLGREMVIEVKRIFDFLGHADVAACRKVSQRWKSVVDQHVLSSWSEAKRCRFGWMYGILRLKNGSVAFDVDRDQPEDCIVRGCRVDDGGRAILVHRYCRGNQRDLRDRYPDPHERSLMQSCQAMTRLEMNAFVVGGLSAGPARQLPEGDNNHQVESVQLSPSPLPGVPNDLHVIEVIACRDVIIVKGVVTYCQVTDEVNLNISQRHFAWVFHRGSGREIRRHEVAAFAQTGRFFHARATPNIMGKAEDVIYSCTLQEDPSFFGAKSMEVCKVDCKTGDFVQTYQLSAPDGHRLVYSTYWLAAPGRFAVKCVPEGTISSGDSLAVFKVEGHRAGAIEKVVPLGSRGLPQEEHVWHDALLVDHFLVASTVHKNKLTLETLDLNTMVSEEACIEDTAIGADGWALQMSSSLGLVIVTLGSNRHFFDVTTKTFLLHGRDIPGRARNSEDEFLAVIAGGLSVHNSGLNDSLTINNMLADVDDYGTDMKERDVLGELRQHGFVKDDESPRQCWFRHPTPAMYLDYSKSIFLDVVKKDQMMVKDYYLIDKLVELEFVID
jgi:hypothetical protein